MNPARLLFAAVLGLFAQAGPTLAQAPLSNPPTLQQQMDLQLRLDELQARQDQAARAALIQQNRLMVLESQVRTEQALSDLRARSAAPTLPPPREHPAAAPLSLGQMASIPDAALVDSNARVWEAASNHP